MIENGVSGCMLPFAQVAEQFRLIETPTRTVYLPLGAGAELCRQLRDGKMSRLLRLRSSSGSSRRPQEPYICLSALALSCADSCATGR